MKYIQVFLWLAVLFGAVQIYYVMRTRALRGFSKRWKFRYIGPPPKLYWPVTYPIARPPVPSWFSHHSFSGWHISRIYNVIEGEKNGVEVLIFDAILGEQRGSHPCTLIACKAEESSFQAVASVDRVFKANGWTVLHGVWFLWFSWTMRVSRIEKHLNGLRP